jgi:hypothetical protein
MRAAGRLKPDVRHGAAPFGPRGRWRTVLAAAPALWFCACGGGKGGSAEGTGSPLCAAGSLGAQDPQPGTAPLRRLTRFEYGRTVHDLVGADPTIADALPPDEEEMGFDDIADAYSVSALHAQGYLEVAEQAANDFAARAPDRTAVAGCDPVAGDPACLDAFIDAFGRVAWRRPLDADEHAAMVALHQATDTPGTGDGLSAVVTAMLQAPQFLYRPEPVPAGTTAAQPLDGYALATRLSYLITGRGPDAQLLDVAAGGGLAATPGLLAQADRLLENAGSGDVFVHFVNEWWELEPLPTVEKDESLYRLWTSAMPAAFGQETSLFLLDAWQSGAPLGGLLTSPATFADTDLATFYGIPAPAAGTGFQRVALDPARGAGLFTQGAFLSTHAHADQTSPVLRGKFVRARLFCTPPQQPPPNIVVKPPTVDPRLSTRQRFEQHSMDPLCAGCHVNMDPIGFGFEHYDATGRWRDVDGEQPVDATGTLTGTDVDGDFDGAAQLAGKLAASGQVAACTATQWFRYAFGRSEVLPADGCALATLADALAKKGGGDFRTMVRATVTLPAFRLRAPEVSP